MLRKEEILVYVQQGQTLPGWLVLRPKVAYLAKLAIIYALLAAVVIALAAYFVTQNTFVITPIFSAGSLDPSAFQTWRYIDEGVLAILIGLFVGGSLKYMLDLMALDAHVLVLMPEGFLLKKRKTEQLVAYSAVAGISVRADRYGNITLNIKAIGTKTQYRVQFDGRYGDGRMLAAQIVNAQRQYVASQQKSGVQ